MTEMLNKQEVLTELERLQAAGSKLLGMDGFRMQPDGSYEAPVDLILDFTAAEAGSSTPTERFAEARHFVMNNDSPQVRWEIVTGSEE